MRLEDRAFFKAHYARYPQVHSDNTFTNMVCWNHFADYRYARMDGSIILSSTIGGVTRFRPPIGPRDTGLMAELLGLACRAGDGQPVGFMDRATADWVQDNFGPVEVEMDRDQSEYVYRARDLADLPNGMYHSARRQLNRFKRSYSYTVEPFTPDKSGEARKFLLEWCDWKGTDGDPGLRNEKEAFLFSIDHFAALGLSGLIIRVKDKIGAMSIFEPLNENTALIHFEKGLPDCEGIYKAINMETAAVLADKFEFINRESDMGIPGLREAKMRYHPHHMVEVYSMKGKLPGMHRCLCDCLSGFREAAGKVCW